MFNKSKLKELENRILLLEDPYLFDIGDEVKYVFNWDDNNVQLVKLATIVNRYQNEYGRKKYSALIKNSRTILDNIAEYGFVQSNSVKFKIVK